ncbi:MAG: ribonuclease E/G [Butyrivibrio sp.]|nr:ribonuclease E/G [Butyrivibrio sp.]
MAEIVTCTYNQKTVVAAYIDNKMQYLSVVRDSDVGRIYVCKVDHIVRNLSAAFVRYEKDKTGYVQLKSIDKALVLNRNLSEEDSVRQGDEVLLQIESEAVKLKKPHLTGNLSISGRYCVVTVGRKGVGASLKLSKDVRDELISSVKSFYPKMTEIISSSTPISTIGIIIRTDAGLLPKETVVKKLYEDVQNTVKSLSSVYSEGKTRTVYSLIYGNSSSSVSSHIEDAAAFLRSRGENEYSFTENDTIHGAIADIDRLLGNRIWLKSGAFIIIEQLESFNAIDVNTGKAIKGKEDISLSVNLEAAGEIMRQIRLRNLTGMILIDFINMKDDNSYDILRDKITELARFDTQHTSFIDVTGLGIVELTRSKKDMSLREQLTK